ncbi:hypothetical protein NEOLEDRAFT_597909 [Neolentinus lepideus HHB14362 ss-1]|uniref:Uncharacterized protein n=1 Tax=Neolentinus lepideus HHB14362 ss-1 TaxID=1314782 RepID=A0A165VAK6_9AGAM|nr:hypothetical protein NEOLEDRAFT_597909 [Neolentinus lepideus HHB14362 ss-1]
MPAVTAPYNSPRQRTVCTRQLSMRTVPIQPTAFYIQVPAPRIYRPRRHFRAFFFKVAPRFRSNLRHRTPAAWLRAPEWGDDQCAVYILYAGCATAWVIWSTLLPFHNIVDVTLGMQSCLLDRPRGRARSVYLGRPLCGPSWNSVLTEHTYIHAGWSSGLGSIYAEVAPATARCPVCIAARFHFPFSRPLPRRPCRCADAENLLRRPVFLTCEGYGSITYTEDSGGVLL